MQLSLDFDAPSSPVRAEPSIEDRLALLLDSPCEVVWTRNRRVMVSARRVEGRVQVRLQRLFREADPPTVEAVARLLRHNDPAARDRLHGFIRREQERRERFLSRSTETPGSDENRRTRAAGIGQAQGFDTRPLRRLRTRGQVHDLLEIFEALIEREEVDVEGLRITWGRRTRARQGGLFGRPRSRKCIQLGVYLPQERLIRVHPALDQSWVPRYYVESVVHHELLHHLIPAVRVGGRDHVHTAEFRRREAAFEHHQRARRWEDEHLARLLQS